MEGLLAIRSALSYSQTGPVRTRQVSEKSQVSRTAPDWEADKLILTMDEPSGLSLAKGSMAVAGGELWDELDKRRFLSDRTHYTNDWRVCS